MNGKAIKVVTVVLNFPTVIAIFIVYAKAIASAMFGNSYFTASAAKVERLKEDIAELDDAETGCKRNPPTYTIQQRNAALELVKADLRSLRNDVQEVANADPANAEAIIASSGMSIKGKSFHGKKQNTAKDGIESGSVELTAEGPGFHDWRMSTDGINWILLPSSSKSSTTAKDLTPGTIYYFQNRKVFPGNEKGEWSQSIAIMVR